MKPLLLFLLAAGLAAATQPFFFIQMTDPQFGMYTADKGFAQETANFEFAIATANRLRPAFVVVTGDLINRAGDPVYIAEYKRIAAKLGQGIRIYNVPGNHDVGNKPTPESLAVWRRNFGPDYYSFSQGDARFFVLDSSLIAAPGGASEEASRQEAWLKAELERARGARRLIVLQHHPWFLEKPDEPDQYFNIPLGMRRRYLELLREHGVSHVFAGHLHRNAGGRDDGLEMVSTAPVGMPLEGARSGIRLVWVTDQGIRHEFYDFGSLPKTAVMPEAKLTAEQRQLQVDSFEYVWKTVQEKHYDPKFGGVDWQAARRELRPKIDSAGTAADARAVLRELIGRLHLTHFGIIPADAYNEMQGGAGSGEGETGIDARVIGGRALVTAVAARSPGEAAGVRPGWEMLSIEGEALAPVLGRVAESVHGSTLEPARLALAVLSRLHGEPGRGVRVEFRDGRGATVNANVGRAAPRGHVARFGFLPPMAVWAESKTLPGGAGYVGFNYFLDPERVMKTFGDAVASSIEAPGFVIDLRGNGGGLAPMTMGMAGWFVGESGRQLGTLSMRNLQLKLSITPRPQTYKGPLAILVDGLSGSCSEIFAGGLQDLGRGRIFGSRTAGAALPSAIEKLPNGDGFQYALADYVSASGKRLEGAGVMPDVEVAPTREALLAGRDLVLEAALQWMGTQRK